MAAHPLIIPSSKFASYSDAFLGSAVTSTKQLLILNLPTPVSVFLPPSTLELIYQTSPQRQRVIDLFRKLADTGSASNQTKVVSLLKRTIATLAINRQLVHTLTDWYHDYLEGGEVETMASHIYNLSQHSAKGNVNFIESILYIWAESLEQCLLKKGHSHQACLAPTGIFIQSQPKFDLSGIIFTSHPQKLTKASLVVYLWKHTDKSQTQTPDEILDLDMRSGMILQRHHLSANNQLTKLISVNPVQLSSIISLGSRIKQHSLQETSARFIVSNQQILFTELPANYRLPSLVKKKTRTATRLLMRVSLVSQVKRTATASDGVGVLNLDLSKQSPEQLLTIIGQINELLPSNQILLLQPQSPVLPGEWSKYAKLLTQIKDKLSRPVALLPDRINQPEDWLTIANLPVFKTSISQFQPLWLEIATPAMALSLRSINISLVGGIVINQPQILAWATGQTALEKYSLGVSNQNHLVFGQLLEAVMTVVNNQVSVKPLPVWVELSQADPLVIAKVINSGCQAILSSPSEVSTMRDRLQQAEKEVWKNRIII